MNSNISQAIGCAWFAVFVKYWIEFFYVLRIGDIAASANGEIMVAFGMFEDDIETWH